MLIKNIDKPVGKMILYEPHGVRCILSFDFHTVYVYGKLFGGNKDKVIGCLHMVQENINFVQCIDINECDYAGACGKGALCVNLPGAHKCECPEGYNGDPEEECVDVDECLRSPCGRSAQCTNVHGSFRCSCPEGMSGDPWVGCHGG